MNKLLTILFLCSFVISNAQTRLYPGTAAASLSPAFNASWNVTTGASRYKMTMSERGAGLADRTTSAVGAAAVRKVLADQWISAPMLAQTVTGTLTGQMKGKISSTSSSTGQLFAYLRVCNSSGTITQDIGTLTTTNLTTTTTNRTLISLNVGSVTISDGDCFVIEVGGNYSSGSNTTRTFTINKGNDRGTDLPVNNTATTADDPWFEFSYNIAFKASTWYVSPSGSDGNAGTLASPFRNWAKFSDVADAADTCYFRGGTYAPTTSTATNYHCWWRNLKGNSASRIYMLNYPTESPIYDFSGFVTVNTDPWCVYLDDCDYLTITGLRVRALAQVASGLGVSRGWAITDGSSNNIMNQCVADSMGGGGFVFGNGSGNTINYCDSYYNADPYSGGSPYGGADGFAIAGGVTQTGLSINYCRAWWNSDDGFDNFGIDGTITYRGNWSFWNGYIPGGFSTGGNGEGFKLGPTATSKLTDTLRWLYENLSFENRTSGFGQNAGRCLYVLYNNTSYKNGTYGFWWGWENATVQNFKNNCAYANVTADLEDAGSNVPATYNSWNGTITVSDADFLSVSSVGMDGARGSNGSLPVTNFLKLAAGSDLINAGLNVGYGDDVNWAQYQSTTRYVGRIF